MPAHAIAHDTAAARPASPLLRGALKLDAAVTGANGLAYLALAGPLHDLLGVDAGILRGLGAFLVAFAALVLWTATRPAPPRAAVIAIVELNLLWALASVVVAALGTLDPTTVGVVWTLMQATTVAAFAAAQWIGLRQG